MIPHLGLPGDRRLGVMTTPRPGAHGRLTRPAVVFVIRSIAAVLLISIGCLGCGPQAATAAPSPAVAVAEGCIPMVNARALVRDIEALFVAMDARDAELISSKAMAVAIAGANLRANPGSAELGQQLTELATDAVVGGNQVHQGIQPGGQALAYVRGLRDLRSATRALPAAEAALVQQGGVC